MWRNIMSLTKKKNWFYIIVQIYEIRAKVWVYKLSNINIHIVPHIYFELFYLQTWRIQTSLLRNAIYTFIVHTNKQTNKKGNSLPPTRFGRILLQPTRWQLKRLFTCIFSHMTFLMSHMTFLNNTQWIVYLIDMQWVEGEFLCPYIPLLYFYFCYQPYQTT